MVAGTNFKVFLSMLISLPKYLRILLVNDVATRCAKITTANKGFISSVYCVIAIK